MPFVDLADLKFFLNHINNPNVKNDQGGFT
jgi:hypothetical protein